jgi:hypothetical protein
MIEAILGAEEVLAGYRIASACARIARISPPALNAFGLALRSTTTRSPARSPSSSTVSSSSTIEAVKAFKALLRVRVMRSASPMRSACTDTVSSLPAVPPVLIVSAVNLGIEVTDLRGGGHPRVVVW